MTFVFMLIFSLFTKFSPHVAPPPRHPIHTHTFPKTITIQSALFVLGRTYFVLFRVLGMIRWVSVVIGTDIDVTSMNVS